MRKRIALAFIICAFVPAMYAAELVRLVRYKISAGDLPSGIAAVDDYRRVKGVDGEYLDAVGWLARGAEMLHRPDLAGQFVAELRHEITSETAENMVPLGAAIEVEGKLIAAREGRGSAIRFLDAELAHAAAVPLRARIQKNINSLSLEGSPAPAIDGDSHIGALAVPSMESLRGKPILLYFWAWGCGDCKAQSVSLNRIWEKYRTRGLQMVTATRDYGSVDDKPATPEQEKVQIEKTWQELYPALADVPTAISTETMVRYGVSATPTFVLVDRRGIVRLYTPTRLSEGELSRRIEEVLAE